MLDLIAETFPRLITAMRRRGVSRADAAGLILAARYGSRALAWTASDCTQARRVIASAFYRRARPVRLVQEG